MANIVCAQCNLKFNNSELLEQHLLSDHATPGQPIDSAPPPPAVTDPDFEETMKLIEADKAKKQAELDRIQAKKSQSPVTVPIEKKNLDLEYKYTGQAGCGHDLATLMVEAGGKLYATGFCIPCNKQVQSIEVSPLPKLNIPGRIVLDKKK